MGWLRFNELVHYLWSVYFLLRLKVPFVKKRSDIVVGCQTFVVGKK